MTAPIQPADSPHAIARAATFLREGGLVAMPTETVYGLAADASNAAAVARLYAAKGRPRFNPLIAHVTGAAMAQTLVAWPDLAGELAAAFWPGPLTLVLPKLAEAPICDLANAGLMSVAIRAPGHPGAQALLTAFGGPLVAPSANPSGSVSPTTARHVSDGLGDRLDLILDGGACTVGLESTVIAILDGRATLLRPGGLERSRIEAITGPLASAGQGDAPASPGMLASHYAPRAPIRLDATHAEAGEVLLGFGAIDGDLNLSPNGDLTEAAARLFSALREMDARGPKHIAVAPIPDEGLGEAINDRLQRAAAPRTGP
ncbi:L-threonylcarbamoyladenylate synthase [uncultured Maricaulis sp.]|uniref:L-threonylcarbamoyladenylate synthase n=1 Tax=uncultured Maricaulis sp. TaxID=174710 RepID=UPI0030D96B21|tara:strand:- start:39521 stop:40471 length:951 start_codon:yes stop_codon:yes gene_type:complete